MTHAEALERFAARWGVTPPEPADVAERAAIRLEHVDLRSESDPRFRPILDALLDRLPMELATA